jgi:hypothetical protein
MSAIGPDYMRTYENAGVRNHDTTSSVRNGNIKSLSREWFGHLRFIGNWEGASQYDCIGIGESYVKQFFFLQSDNSQSATIWPFRISILTADQMKFVVAINNCDNLPIRIQHIAIDHQLISIFAESEQWIAANGDQDFTLDNLILLVPIHKRPEVKKERIVGNCDTDKTFAGILGWHWIIGGNKPAVRHLGFFQRSRRNELITDGSYAQHNDHSYGSDPTADQCGLNQLKYEPSDEKPPESLVGFWPHESQIQEEPQSTRQKRTYDLAWALFVVLNLFDLIHSMLPTDAVPAHEHERGQRVEIHRQ